MASPFSIEPEFMYARTKSPRRSREKYSGGPKRSAKAARGGARNIRAMTLTVPATYEPTAAMARAGPARPLRAMA